MEMRENTSEDFIKFKEKFDKTISKLTIELLKDVGSPTYMASFLLQAAEEHLKKNIAHIFKAKGDPLAAAQYGRKFVDTMKDRHGDLEIVVSLIEEIVEKNNITETKGDIDLRVHEVNSSEFKK